MDTTVKLSCYIDERRRLFADLRIRNMKNILVISILLSVFVCGFDAKKLPSFIKKCRRNDPELNTCIKNTMLDLRRYLPKGIPQLKIAPMDPYVLASSSIETSWMKVVFTNVRLYNAFDFDINFLDVDLENDVIKVNLTQKYTELKCHYELDGQILQVPLHGSGEIESNFTDTKTSSIMRGKKIQRKGQHYLMLEKNTFKLNPEALQYFYFHNLFENNPELTESVNNIFKENRNELAVEIVPLLEDIISKIYLSFFSGVFSSYSLEELFI